MSGWHFWQASLPTNLLAPGVLARVCAVSCAPAIAQQDSTAIARTERFRKGPPATSPILPLGLSRTLVNIIPRTGRSPHLFVVGWAILPAAAFQAASSSLRRLKAGCSQDWLP